MLMHHLERLDRFGRFFSYFSGQCLYERKLFCFQFKHISLIPPADSTHPDPVVIVKNKTSL